MGWPVDAYQANGCDDAISIAERKSIVAAVIQPLLEPWAKMFSHDL